MPRSRRRQFSNPTKPFDKSILSASKAELVRIARFFDLDATGSTKDLQRRLDTFLKDNAATLLHEPDFMRLYPKRVRNALSTSHPARNDDDSPTRQQSPSEAWPEWGGITAGEASGDENIHSTPPRRSVTLQSEDLDHNPRGERDNMIAHLSSLDDNTLQRALLVAHNQRTSITLQPLFPTPLSLLHINGHELPKHIGA